MSRNPDSTAVGTANADCPANNQTIQCQIAKTFPTDNELKNGISVCLGTLNTSTGQISTPTTAPTIGAPVTVRTKFPFHFLTSLFGASITLTSTQTERLEAAPTWGGGNVGATGVNACAAMRSHRSPESERGAVIVMVAIWLPVLALFVSFAVDFAHFFDYSRNLQNRADAAALAASVAYGNTCFSTPTAAQTDAIGKVAQQYAGPPNQNPGSPYTVPNNLPYAYSTFTQSQYLNVPNLTKGTPQNFHMRLNSTRNWPNGANWEMGTAGKNTSSLALCSSRDEDGKVGPMIDVRLTQANLGLFFPLFGFSPSISAHARAGLQGEASTNAAPIAVGDTGQIPCVSARLVNATTNALIQTVTLTKKPPDPLNPTAPVQWDNSAAPASFTMPASDNVYVQPFLSDCNGTGAVYDDGARTRAC